MGSGLTAKACSKAPKRFKIFECKADDPFLCKAIPTGLEMCSRQEFNVDSDTYEQENIQKAARRNLQEKACEVESRQKNVWCASQEFRAVQMYL